MNQEGIIQCQNQSIMQQNFFFQKNHYPEK